MNLDLVAGYITPIYKPSVCRLITFLWSRHAKDSSNDEDMFADSSGEESLKTFGFTTDMLSTISSAIDSSKTDAVESESLVPSEVPIEIAADSNKDGIVEKNTTAGMTEEENTFYLQYIKGNNYSYPVSGAIK